LISLLLMLLMLRLRLLIGGNLFSSSARGGPHAATANASPATRRIQLGRPPTAARRSAWSATVA